MTAITEVYDSADFGQDYYFEPHDPAILDPDQFSPQQRFRRFFLGRLPGAFQRKNSMGHSTQVIVTGKPPRRDEGTIFSESLESMTRTSCSSEEVRQQAHDGKEDDENSLCGSLTYSVESERYHRQNSSVDHCIDDYMDTASGRRAGVVSDERNNNNKKSQFDCFHASAEESNRFPCFQPLSWVGILFQNLLKNTDGKKVVYVVEETDNIRK